MANSSARDGSQPDDDRELMDAEEVAAMLGMTVDWVYEQSRRARIPTIRLGRYLRYRRAAIEQWLLSIEHGTVEAIDKSGRAALTRPRPGTGG